MNASDSNACRRCGAPIPGPPAETACPACLLSGALGPGEGGTDTLTANPGRSLPSDDPGAFPRRLAGYRLRGLLGRGGMGTVYEAEHLATGRRLALKMLDRRLDSPEMRQRFLREGRLAAGVRHPNSLYVFGAEEIDGAPVITMEIAGLGTMKDRLEKRGPLPVPEAVDAILDVIAGLEAASAAGVLHRDVKPSNCFVGPDGAVKVGDYGLSVSTLAREDSYVTATGVVMGTPAYASPEQLRGDDLDVRADIYSVGATLFTLLTGRAPFEGRNAVQVVANAVNRKPAPLGELREGVPPGLERAVARCLAKEPAGRYSGYAALREALLPFGSREPKPAPMTIRVAAGWIDFLIAFLPAYVALMLTVGGEELIVRPLVERTLASSAHYFLLLGSGLLYFALLEGIRGAGIGKRLRGLRVVRPNGRPPGVARASIRIVVPLLCVEGVRMPLMMAMVSDATWTGLQTAVYVVVTCVCACIPGLLALRARPDNGFATLWDLASGTRVVVRPRASAPVPIGPTRRPDVPDEGTDALGPYRVVGNVVPGRWLAASDPVLRRGVWLLRRTGCRPSAARRRVARPGRPRWLQEVEADEAGWDAYEAIAGEPLALRVGRGERVPWSTLRIWLHDLATELWKAEGDETVPEELSLDHVWITAEGRAILLDEPWPSAGASSEPIPARDVRSLQRFLDAVAGCVEPTGVPLHARPVLRNLAAAKFQKLSFLAGTLQGLLERPADVGRGVRAGSLFMLPVYTWIAFVVGRYHDKPWDDPLRIVTVSALAVLGVFALAQFLGLPFRGTAGQSIFRLAVVDGEGRPATVLRLLGRWAIVWLPLFVPVSLAVWALDRTGDAAIVAALALVLLWIGAAAYAVLRPGCGLHDRLAGTWVVRR